MTEIIKLESGQEITLDNNLAWLMEYQDQFGEDILPTLMPLVMSLSDIIGGLVESDVDLNNLGAKDIMDLLKTEAAINAGIKLSVFKTTDLVNIVWALAKTADDTIAPPKKWIRQFEDGFPFDIIIPKAAALIVKGVVSSKNLERLTAATSRLQPERKKKIKKQ